MNSIVEYKAWLSPLWGQILFHYKWIHSLKNKRQMICSEAKLWSICMSFWKTSYLVPKNLQWHSSVNMSIDCLPNEIVVKIITNLPVYDRIRCQQVCDRWKNLSHIFMRDVKAFNFGHHWKICDDDGHRPLDNNGLTHGCETDLKLFDETTLLANILGSLLNLKCLNVYLRNEASVKVISKLCPDLECLTLVSFQDQVMLSCIEMVSMLGHSLRHLKICDESRVLRRNELDYRLVSMLTKCTKLEVFHMCRLHLGADSFAAIGPNIREISAQFGGELIQSLSDRHSNSLQTLLIRHSIINSWRMQTICQHFVNLKKLYVESYTDCDDFVFCQAIARMTQLEHLEINFIPKLYNGFLCIDHCLTHIARNCPKLRQLSLSNCINAEISDDILVNLMSYCPHIERIHFWKFGDMRRVTKTGIDSVLSASRLIYLTLEALLFNHRLEYSRDSIQTVFDANPYLNFVYLFVHKFSRNPNLLNWPQVLF